MSSDNGSPVSDKEILIASWSLKSPDEHGEAQGRVKLDYSNANAPESTSECQDKRVVVKTTEIEPNGRYRSIIKLFIRYETNPRVEAMGTGWLIAPDILVTAGHCTFPRGFKRAISIRAYQGYHGKTSIGLGNVSYRYGIQVATTPGWVEGFTKPGDLSVVKLNRPFGSGKPVNYEETPMKGIQAMIGVVGYPADKISRGEPGARMYEMFLPTNYDRTRSDHHMLDYPISTYAGQSGSPVLIEKGGACTSIGVHTYSGKSVNSATVLDYDNHLNSYHAFLAGNMWEGARRGTVPAGVPVPDGVTYYIVDRSESIVEPVIVAPLQCGQ